MSTCRSTRPRMPIARWTSETRSRCSCARRSLEQTKRRDLIARIFVTGSVDGLGRAAAQTLLEDGHEVVVHARDTDRLAAVRDLVDRGAEAVVGDLSDLAETRGVADQVNDLGRMDAVIHNAGVRGGPHVLPVNVVAPYLLTALIDRPQRLIYLSSSMHRG